MALDSTRADVRADLINRGIGAGFVFGAAGGFLTFIVFAAKLVLMSDFDRYRLRALDAVRPDHGRRPGARRALLDASTRSSQSGSRSPCTATSTCPTPKVDASRAAGAIKVPVWGIFFVKKS